MPTPYVNRHIILKNRPTGRPTLDDFEIVETPVPQLPDNGVLRRTIYLSLDPYMRGRMSDAASYATPVAIGQTMVGHTVSTVVESKHAAFQPGDFVTGYDGWQQYGLSTGGDLRKLNPAEAPISTAVGILGMPGMTAYVGLLDIGQPKPGETVLVSAASGAVGSVVDELGFDACVNYKDANFTRALREACPNGVDVYFENVGGDVLAAAMRLLNVNARIPLCGMISEYNATTPVAGPSLRPLLVKRALIKGFIVSDHGNRLPDFLRDCSAWLREGRLKFREDIVEGLDAAPTAILRLFDGTNFGKLLVRVSPDPTK